MDNEFYVLMMHPNNTCTPLGLHARSVKECDAAIRWQRKGGFNGRYAVCEHRNGAFYERETNEAFRPLRGCFTIEAWHDFADRLAEGNLTHKIRILAPGFYTERDGGNWYIVTPAHDDRIGEVFAKRETAQDALIWLSGGTTPKNWSLLRVNDLSIALDCAQGFEATLWTKAVAQHFPNFKPHQQVKP